MFTDLPAPACGRGWAGADARLSGVVPARQGDHPEEVDRPEMNGRDRAKNLRSLSPHLTRLFLSGSTANVLAHLGVPDGEWGGE